MFEYFPDNYNWSLAVSLAIAMGGEMSEVDSACRPLRGLAAAAVDDATQRRGSTRSRRPPPGLTNLRHEMRQRAISARPRENAGAHACTI